MKCPFCQYYNSIVIDTRTTEDNNAVRRRRECLECKKRFTTYERNESLAFTVIKRDKLTEPFNREKLIGGLIRACQKRPVTRDQMEDIANKIEFEISNKYRREISSEVIGELVINFLKDIDEVSCVRFASVYRSFKDVDGFIREISKMRSENS